MSQAVRTYPGGTILGLRPGQIVDGRFEILNLIGYGGQGVVLRVKHLEWEKYLALKLPLPEVVESQVNRDRFLQEAETWIRMGVHPRIVRCWFIQSINGLPGLFLDLISGGSLESRIPREDSAPVDWSQVLHTMIQVAEGLGHSHSMGIVHRDLKPENILVREDGSVCLTDFGLVKSFRNPSLEQVEEGAVESDPSVTGTRQFVGTPRYGAPEQWNKALKVGPATDIYSLGIIFYELSCGRRPFDAPGEEPDPLTLIHRHLQNPPPDPRTFRANIPEPIVQLILRCLEKESTGRPQSSQELLQLLRGLLKHQCGEDYLPPDPVPGREKPDLLNNAAVSLHSLGKIEQSRELWRRGLLLQAGHPECVYNLVQVDKREGKITSGEALRILRRAQATYQMALLCIEEGLGTNAIDLLGTIPEESKQGLAYRIEGDAHMYAKQFEEAREAYERATRSMPQDPTTRSRRDLASLGRRGKDGHIFFPSSNCAYREQLPSAGHHLALSARGELLIRFSSEDVSSTKLADGQVAERSPRSDSGGPVTSSWSNEAELLLQDQSGFEFRSADGARLLKRHKGKVLAVSRALTLVVFQNSDGVYLMDRGRNRTGRFSFPAGPVHASFTPDEKRLFFLTPEGQVAEGTSQFEKQVLGWPKSVPRFQGVCCFQIDSTGVLFLAWTSGQFQAVNLGQKTMEFSLKLPFRPRVLLLSADESHVVVSSPEEFGVLKRDGKVVLRGAGPCTLDPSRRYAMSWSEGYCSLYNLHPFRRLRTWADKVEQPLLFQFSANGSKAVSLAKSGACQVWEVDEPHRVFERSLLLTKGESYEQLIRSYNSYRDLFEQAQRLFAQERYFLCYKTLENARAVPGFLQDSEALDLQWKVASKLRRLGLEAVWERLYTGDVCSAALSDTHNSLLVAGSREWAVREFGLAGGKIRLSQTVESPVLGTRYVDSDADSSLLFVLLESGVLHCHRVNNGEVVHSQSLGLGPLIEATGLEDSFFVWSESGYLGFYEFSSLEFRNCYQFQDVDIRKAFPLKDDKVFLLTGRGPAVVDLKNGSMKSGLPVTLKQLPGEPTFAADHNHQNLLMLGFSDGTLLIVDRRNGRVLMTINHNKGPITGACLQLSKGIGVAVTQTGRLSIFDLANLGEPFELFTAHTEPIASLRLSSDARYISTRTRSGEFRFWELSWTFAEEPGDVQLDWLPTGALGKLGRFLGLR